MSKTEVVDTVNKKELEIFVYPSDKFIISRIYNVSIPINRIRYFEIIDADQDSSKTDIDTPPYVVIAYTNLDGIESVPLNEYDTIQDAYDALADYSRYTFNGRNEDL